jgi:transaldolase
MKNEGIKIYADGANVKDMIHLYESNKEIRGFTTNPTLMRSAGVSDYVSFIKECLYNIKDLPISFEVFLDDNEGMYDQAMKLSSFGDNVFVKIPVMNTKGEPTYELINQLSERSVKLNITAIFTIEQIANVINAVSNDVPNVISIFAGRISDTGKNPEKQIEYAKNEKKDSSEVLWASPRSVYNYYEAMRCGCDIITMTPDLIKKLSLKDKDLTEYSLETVKMFFNDAQSAGYVL